MNEHGRVAPQPAPDAEGEWKAFGRIVHQPGKDERGHPADRFQFEVENTNGLLEPGEAERIAARIVSDHTLAASVPKLVEALRAAPDADYVQRLENAFLMAYDLAGIDVEPLPERLPESAYVPGYMDQVRELREVFAVASEHVRTALASAQIQEKQ
jgi:hypothetical protein